MKNAAVMTEMGREYLELIEINTQLAKWMNNLM
jgi:hypothetical protein